MTKNSFIKAKDANLNVKIPKEEYRELQIIANEIGLTLSSMVRMLLYSRLEKVKKSGINQDFLDKE